MQRSLPGGSGDALRIWTGPFVCVVVSVTVSFQGADAVSTEGGWLLASLLSVMFKVSGAPSPWPARHMLFGMLALLGGFLVMGLD